MLPSGSVIRCLREQCVLIKIGICSHKGRDCCLCPSLQDSDVEGHHSVDAGVNLSTCSSRSQSGWSRFVHFMLFALAVSLSPEESVTKRRDWSMDRQSDDDVLT